MGSLTGQEHVNPLDISSTMAFATQPHPAAWPAVTLQTQSLLGCMRKSCVDCGCAKTLEPNKHREFLAISPPWDFSEKPEEAVPFRMRALDPGKWPFQQGQCIPEMQSWLNIDVITA